MIAPAPSLRVFVTCAMSCAKLKVMSTPASGWPNTRPLIRLERGRWTLLSRQASPSSSGVTATGAKAVAGSRRVGAHGHVVGDHRDFGFEVDAPGLVAEVRIVART